MAWDTAYATLCQAAGNDLIEFLAKEGVPQEGWRVALSPEAVVEAARVVASEFPPEALGGPVEAMTQRQLCAFAETAKGLILIDWWWVIGDRTTRNPQVRVKLIAFIEEKAGRSIRLETPESSGPPENRRDHGLSPLGRLHRP